jgi:two-component system sensor histidine kinase UhpB
MKASLRYIILFFILLYSFVTYAQNSWLDSVRKAAASQKEDTNKVNALNSLSGIYQISYPDSGLAYAQKALALAEKLHFESGIFLAEITASESLMILGNYPLELDYAFKALSLAKKLNTPTAIAAANAKLAGCYYSLGEYAVSLSYWREVMKWAEQFSPEEIWGNWGFLSRIYNGMNQHNSAMFYAKKLYETIKGNERLYKQDEESLTQVRVMTTALGNAFAGKADYDSALYYYRWGILVSANNNMEINLVDDYNGIAAVYKATGKPDSAVWYAEKVLAAKMAKSYPVSLLKATNLLSDIYELKNKPDSTLKYFRLATALKDSLFNLGKMSAIQNITYKEHEKQQAIEANKLKLQNRYKIYFLLAGFITLLVITGIIIKNKRQKQLQKMRNSIADDLHDDIGSALSSISIMSELAKEKSPEALPLLTSIGESTTTIQENMSDIVWTINSKNDRFENVTQRMNQFASEMLDAKNIELDFKTDTSLASLKLTMEQRKNFYLFFKEVINNAAKYADAKKVSVCIAQKDHYVEMKITDDGKGFDTNKIFSGNGMNTLKKRASELNGDYKITSNINEGTTIQLKFKIT